jgi:8-oxo-dGTP pyrophosphatase MutT (NUDIX family)
VLLLWRVPQKGGFWQGVTGAPEPGETDGEAAVREVREETGFHVEVEPLGFRYDLHRSEEARGLWLELYGDDDIDTIPEEAFAAEVDPGAEPIIDPVEHDEFRWCSFDEADSLLKWEENRRALQRLRERLDDD